MAGFDFPKSTLNTKLLVLHILSKVSIPIDYDTFRDLSMNAGGINYFVFAQVVPELLNSGHLAQNAELYSITEKGRSACAAAESSLSSALLMYCDRKIDAWKTDTFVQGNVKELHDGMFQVNLKLLDDHGLVFSLSLQAPSEAEGAQIVHRFKQHPDRIYNGILNVLLSDAEKKG